MEEFIYFHDFISILLTFIISGVFFIIVSLVVQGLTLLNIEESENLEIV